MELTDFQRKLGSQKRITAINGNFMKLFITGKTVYTKLFVYAGKVYAVSEHDDTDTIGIISITNRNGDLTERDEIEVTEVRAHAAVGKVIYN